MQHLAAFWRWLRAYAAHDDPLVASGNWIALVVAWNQPFYPLYLYGIVGSNLAPSLLTFLSTPFFAVIPALSRKHPTVSRAMVPLVGMANTIISAKAFGVASGVEIFLIPCALIGAALFRPSERLLGLALAGLALVIFIVLHSRYGAPLGVYSPAEYEGMFSLNALSAGTLAVFVGLLMSGAVSDVEQRGR